MVVSYRDLIVWQKSMELVEMIYRLTSKLPRDQAFVLTSQLQRSAVSVPSNIAEGHARESTKDYMRFVSIALGSVAELETQPILCQRMKYLEDAESVNVLRVADEIGKMLRSLQRVLKEKLN